jgi:REP element-mobilizing transposase RayT
MGYDPEIHHRRSIRYDGYDYTLPGAYFVTLLCYGRQCLFGEIRENSIDLSQIGILVSRFWLRIPNHFELASLDEFILMPNHIHGIIWIHEADGKGKAFAKFNLDLDEPTSANALPLRQVGSKSGSLSSIIQNFKSVSTRIVNKQFFKPGNKIWQRNYFERIIRNERELNAIRQYIRDNPLNWETDKENAGKINR